MSSGHVITVETVSPIFSSAIWYIEKEGAKEYSHKGSMSTDGNRLIIKKNDERTLFDVPITEVTSIGIRQGAVIIEHQDNHLTVWLFNYGEQVNKQSAATLIGTTGGPLLSFLAFNGASKVSHNDVTDELSKQWYEVFLANNIAVLEPQKITNWKWLAFIGLGIGVVIITLQILIFFLFQLR